MCSRHFLRNLKMERSKFLTVLGFAAKARKVLTGTDLVLSSIKKGKCKLVILANDMSERSTEQIVSACSMMNIKYITEYDSDELSKAIGKSGRYVIGIEDDGFHESLDKLS